MVGCSSSFSGKVLLLDGVTQVGTDARVNLTRLDGAIATEDVHVIVVAPDGTFSTDKELPTGSYLVEALVPGYKTNSVTIDSATQKTVELKLEPSSRTRASVIGIGNSLDAGRGAGGATLTPPQL